MKKNHDTSDWINFFDGFNVYTNSIRLRSFIEMISQYFPLKQTPLNLIELGSGSGATSKILSDFAKLTKNSIKEVLSRLKEYLNGSNSNVKKVDIFNIDSVVTKYDFVFHQGLMEHFDKTDVIYSLKEQSKISNNIIFDVPNNRDSEQHYGDERFYSFSEWNEMFSEAGFEIVDYYGRMMPGWTHILPYHLHKNKGLGKYLNKIFGLAYVFYIRKKIC